MGLPSKKRTNRSKRERAAHFALKKTNAKKCEKCGATVLSHRACNKCGTYRGRMANNTEKRAARKLRREKRVR